MVMWSKPTAIGTGGVSGGGPSPGAVDRTEHIVRDMPTVINDYVEFGDFHGTSVSFDAWVIGGSAAVRVAKHYTITVSQDLPADEWHLVLPTSKQPDGAADDYEFDVYRDTSTVTIRLRIRRTVGTTAGQVEITIFYNGVTTFVAKTETGSASTPTEILDSAVFSVQGGAAYLGTVSAPAATGRLQIDTEAFWAGRGLVIKEGGKQLRIGGGNINANNGLFINHNGGHDVFVGAPVAVGPALTSTTAYLDIHQSATDRAAMRVFTGVAPTAPNEGDFWVDENNIINFFDGTNVNRLNPKNIVYVHDLSDFPAKAGDGYIPLEQKQYVLCEEIVLDGGTPGYYGFRIPTNVSPTIVGVSSLRIRNQAASMHAVFKSDDFGTALFLINNLNIIFEGTGKLFDIASPSTSEGYIILNTVGVGGANSLGTISDISYFGFVVNYTQCLFNGLTLHNNKAIAVVDHRFYEWLPFGATFLTFTGDQGNIQFNNNFFSCFIPDPPDPPTEFMLKIDCTTTGGTVVGNAFAVPGNVFAAGSKKQEDIDWTYSGNRGLSPSTVTAQGLYEGIAVNTSMPVVGAQVLLDIGTVVWDILERTSPFTKTVIKYIGLETTKLDLSGLAELNAGINKDMRLRFVKIAASELRTVTFDFVENAVIEIPTIRQNGDIISFYNTTGTLPTGLRKDIFYYVRDSTGSVFALAYTLGGPVVGFTDNGTGSNSYAVAEFFGGAGHANITGSTQLAAEALTEVKTDDQLALAVQNETAPISDVACTQAYIKVKI